MLIKSIHLRNIRSYIDETIAFPEGSTLLAGDIGTGKSSILLAVEFALFGIARGVLSGTTLLRLGEDEGYVEMSFEVEGLDCLIKRSLKRSKDDVRQDTGYIIIEGKKTEGTPIELKARVLELLGYPKALLTKSKSLIYRYTVYTPQEEMKAILTEEADIRLDTLRRLFQIDKYQRIRENTQILLKDIRQRQAGLKGQLLDYEEKEKLFTKADLELNLNKEEMAKILPQLEKATDAVAMKRGEIRQKETELKEYNRLKASLQVIDSQIKEKFSLIQLSGRELDTAKSQLVLLDSRLSKFRQDEPAIPQATSPTDIEEQLEQLEKKRTLIMRQTAELESEIRLQQRVKDDQGKIITQLSSLKKCPLCLQDVGQEHVHSIKKEQDKKLELADKAIAEATARLSSSRIEQQDAEKNLLSLRQQQKLGQERRLLLKEKENITNLITEKQAAIMLQEEKQKELKKEIGGLNSDKIDLTEQLIELKDIEHGYETLKKQLEELESGERKLIVLSTRLKAEHDSLSKTRQLLQDELDRKRKAREELKIITQKQNWLQLVFAELMTIMEQNVMMRVYNEFNDIFQQFFSMLLEDANLSVNLNEEFTPIIEQNGYEIEYDGLSGGEKTSIALAYRLALNKVINHLIDTIKTRDLIILDEPTDGFSNDQLDKMRSVLDSLETRQTIIVSHEQKIESFVENVVRISKREHSSSVN